MDYLYRSILMGVLAVGWVTTAAGAATVGGKAPDFKLPDGKGQTVRLEDFRGSYVVLYFYPKDHTPGCTTEACQFRDQHASFQDVNAVIVGVSQDSAQSHAGFAEKYGLPFILLADEKGEVVKAYGAQAGFPLSWIGLGTARKTFLIDPAGNIAKVYPHVDVNRHAEQLLEDIRAMQAKGADESGLEGETPEKAVEED